MHYHAFHYTLLGMSDGSIKVMNMSNYVVFEFHAHSKAVLSMALYPIAPLIVSCGRDSTIKILNLKTFKEVYRTRTKEVPMEMHVVDRSQLFLFSRKTMDVYSINHISSGLASVNSLIYSMARVKSPGTPSRILVNSEDGWVAVESVGVACRERLERLEPVQPTEVQHHPWHPKPAHAHSLPFVHAHTHTHTHTHIPTG
jgi:hypothetical protein